jgi:hypothetical protein
VCLQVLGSLDLLAPEAEPIVTALREEAFPMTHTLTLVTHSIHLRTVDKPS